MDIREFSIEWLKKKYPNNEFYQTPVNEDMVEFAWAWADKVAVDFIMWNEMHPEDWREVCEETYQDWKDEIKAGSKSETPPSEQ